ncbi:MAG: DNA polymerase III subunit alpha [Desulfobacterales bacterium]
MAHSYYSLMRGTASPAAVAAAAKRMGYDRLALTDIDNVYGLQPFLNACRHEHITPIVGAAISDGTGSPAAVCLVETEEGYTNLCRLITRRHTDPAFDLENALTACSGGLTLLVRAPERLVRIHEAGAAVAAAIFQKPDAAALALKQTARRVGVPAVAAPASFFLHPRDYELHRLLRAIDMNTTLFRLDPKDTAAPDAWLAPPEVYRKRFSLWPETITAGRDIAERLTFTAPADTLKMPPWSHPSDPNVSAAKQLRKDAYRGARRRYGADLPENVVDRLEHELAVIDRMGFSSYFLVVKEIVSRSPRICGRGSGAASLAAYCLGITNVCPVKHNLYFERFLNPGRTDPPDIDVDFAWDERDDVIDAVLKRYGDCAAMVCNHVTFKPRMAIRETARVYGLTEQEIGRVCKRLPWFWHLDEADDLLTRIKNLPRMAGCDVPEPWPEIMKRARRIIGIPRHLSVHPGGVIITADPVCRHVPVETAPKGVPIVQWGKDAVEDGGLVKIDLLGNRSLGVIRDAVRNIKENGAAFDEHDWEPEDDPDTHKIVARGATMGCFYIESPAMRLLQKKTGKGDFDHLVIHSSIIRPAANDFIREYIRRLHGGTWEPIHPLLAEVLEETYGIMVYQEDVSKTAVALAGFSHADADGLRKVMSKKDKKRQLLDYRDQFIDGARANGLSSKQITAVWDMMMSFSGYSFCKPHSASYARVSFQAAYLKAHFPAEFMAAVISNQGGFYSAFAYVSEARRLGVTILPPDLNRSDIRWKGRRRLMRTGLLSIRHLTADTRSRIVKKRQNGRFDSAEDAFNRIRPDEAEAESLIRSGALDSLHPGLSRAELLWQFAAFRKRQSGRCAARNLFAPVADVPTPSFPPEDPVQRLRNEFSALGFLCTRHPMDLYADRLSGKNIVKAADMHRFAGKRVRMAGLLITGKVVHTKHGDPMEFLTFEDETGLMETVFFPKAYRRFCALLDKTRPFILSGTVAEDFGVCTLTVSHVQAVPG